MRAGKAVVMALTAALLFTGMAQTASAQGRGRGARPKPQPVPRPGPRRVLHKPPVGARRVVVSGIPYWIHAGIYYRLEHDGYVIVSAPVIRVLPRHHRVVFIGGLVYYIADDVYYRPAPGGYIIVEKPVKVVQAAPAAPAPISVAATSGFTLYVPKRTGEGFVSVELQKLDGGFLGPQGEFYPTMPPVELLTEMYGIPEELRQVRSDTFFIHVPNKDGQSFTRVTLTRHKKGFLGPQGEFYPLMPSVAHLAEMYGADGGTAAEPDSSVVRIRVSKKSGEGTIEVVLEKHEGGYLGPQGEFYPALPSAEQLSEMYGGD